MRSCIPPQQLPATAPQALAAHAPHASSLSHESRLDQATLWPTHRIRSFLITQPLLATHRRAD
ncbi:MAG: hypothetical protein RSG22_16710 [Comamonas sp.]